jgi:hypothetical protein
LNKEQFERALQELKAGKEDIRPSDLTTFSEPLRSALTMAVRIGRISLTDLAKQLELEQQQAQQIAEILIARHLLHISSFSNENEIFYETRLSAMTRPLGRPKPDIWERIDH